ncbi:TauD/TfdA family dioxygenase [Streptomyces sp. SCL15-4]|uniref:TauD/TfdA family dioxygenase n=1 Tax=Streptomyces sp. SCL15-4 TaxID=2967221 RepID=UPI0029667226|nr:TauD/TfdA family dioxygenase [Streptomyces sp. SCL15-4]
MSDLPHLIEGAPGAPPLAEFTALHRDDLRGRLTRHGAVLLRGFPTGPDLLRGVDEVVRAFSGPPLEYAEQSSPRTALHGNIYTSTDYPPDEEIFLHNENSYQASWPGTLFFTCVEPPHTRGATPLADTREIYRSIDPAVRAEFVERGWMVVRNYRPRFGVDWRTSFGTEDRDEIARLCAGRDLGWSWGDGDVLRTEGVRRAVHRHPVTGESVWFNHITFFHDSTLPPDVREGLLELFGADGLPANSYYGDGGTIPDDVIAHLRDRYRTARRRFDWRRGDVLLVDNMLAAHGREPFTGPRRIAVAMAEPVVPAGLR